ASIDLFDKRTYKAYLKKQPDWMKNFASQYNGNPYARLIELGKIAQKQGVIKGILLHQGETNNGDANWPNRVKTVYNDILKDLNLKAE
ncbi:UNVERIFIED_CONTAM: sialate O-acetylesterase, partial [Bacteroidetes bacterium 56_B9]